MDEPDEEHEEVADEGTKDEQSKNLDKVTDFVEESQLDSDKALQAMSALQSAAEQVTAIDDAEQKRLAAVKVNKEDIDFIVSELEVARDLAERVLRQRGGESCAQPRCPVVPEAHVSADPSVSHPCLRLLQLGLRAVSGSAGQASHCLLLQLIPLVQLLQLYAALSFARVALGEP